LFVPLAFGACGDDGTSGGADSGTGADASADQADATQSNTDAIPATDFDAGPRVTLAGVIELDDGEVAVEGATVWIVGAGSGAMATTDANGQFSLESPIGTQFVAVAYDGYWGQVAPLVVPVQGIPDYGQSLVASDQVVADAASDANITIDGDLGMVIVDFHDTSGQGGESATITAAHEGPYTLMNDDLIVSDTLIANGDSMLIFSDVALGSTDVSVSGAPQITFCAAEFGSIADWPILEHAFTMVSAPCGLLD
jgi:hypothetical protein